MVTYHGISLWDAGTVAGRILVEKNRDSRSDQTGLPRFASETAAFLYAKEEVSRHLGELCEYTLRLIDSESSGIFRSQQMILEDPLFSDEILGLIEREHLTALEAIRRVTDNWVKVIEQNGKDTLLYERSFDVSGIGAELEDVLLQKTKDKTAFGEEVCDQKEEGFIYIASMLSPSALMALPKEKIKGLVLQSGAVHAHVAILAKSMKIPTLMGCDLELTGVQDGERAILDLSGAKLLLEPEEQLYEKTLKQEGKTEKHGTQGRRFAESGIKICANVNVPEELTEEVKEQFSGIGLFRTEFLYMNRDSYPTEEEQFTCYRNIVEKMEGKPVVIRTIDLGDDKSAAYLALPKEANPSLGYRGIRLCLDRPQVFVTQLRAIMRAACYGDLRVLYPMITSTREVKQIWQLMEQIGAELEAEGIPYRMPRQGVMIETPAAVLISEELAKITDFFSIGTNDLAQYTLAADRQSTLDYMNHIYDPHHPAILALVRMTVENAHRQGKRVCICGEMGSDVSLLDWFQKIGVDSLSVAPVVMK